MSLEWVLCESSDNISADTADLGKYWICFNGSKWELDHITLDKSGNTWAKHGKYDTEDLAKEAALKLEQAKL